MSTFNEMARAAGFTETQAQFMDEFLAKVPHTHEIEEVEGLEEALAFEDDGVEDEGDEDEDEADEPE